MIPPKPRQPEERLHCILNESAMTLESSLTNPTYTKEQLKKQKSKLTGLQDHTTRLLHNKNNNNKAVSKERLAKLK